MQDDNVTRAVKCEVVAIDVGDIAGAGGMQHSVIAGHDERAAGYTVGGSGGGGDSTVLPYTSRLYLGKTIYQAKSGKPQYHTKPSRRAKGPLIIGGKACYSERPICPVFEFPF